MTNANRNKKTGYNTYKKLVIATLMVSCAENEIYNYPVIEEYKRTSHYGSDIIQLRDKKTFTRKNCHITCKEYYGTYQIVNDTLKLTYQSSSVPEELDYFVKTKNSLTIFSIYDRIKDQYGYLSRDELEKIDDNDLLTKDTAEIEYSLFRK